MMIRVRIIKCLNLLKTTKFNAEILYRSRLLKSIKIINFHCLDDSRRSLREKVARLRQERLSAEANMNAQDTRAFQHHLSQIRRQMLVQTIEGLKRSLEDQSATLKQTCLETSALNDDYALSIKSSKTQK